MIPARLRHWALGLRAAPGLLLDARQRRLLGEMRAFGRGLPGALDAPLAEALAALTPAARDVSLPAGVVRRLADLAALLDRRSPLGLCLRRSLLRFHFLRRAGVPVALQFGARFKAGQPDREVTGHAWVLLDGQPYFESAHDYRGFTAMVRYPPLEA